MPTTISPWSLSMLEVRRLTGWKHRYSLESAGFTRWESEHLLFLQWLVARGRVS